ncbi:S46 family peptidase [Coprobacter tertius]|uniref:Dipeptidyl-peptidase n=1 Tax=Coprobacter tertius TaxID=2944915 RepID=A0ABT1MFL2_9BACT|nr:S46 family peptidase [Coprobacter tertius]MCP9611131.1 S46 family peptidase [Coprobacter tertius]
MKLNKLILPLAFATLFAPVKADEGMWLLPLLKQQNAEKLKELGLKLDVDDIYNPDSTSLKDAIVIFGGGCTGEVISPEGLILTNHHCGYGSIQQHSTVEHDYLKDGFWAMNRSEELPTPGLQVRFIDKIEEVTDIVKTELEKDSTSNIMKPFDTKFLHEIAVNRIGKEYLEEHPYVEVVIKPFYGGNRYFMFTMNVYNDVRMVGAPPSSIGKFGADTDNWMWPRHTGDFSLFRVYMGKDGKPAEYSPENVPLKPKRFLNISLKGIEENDFAMIMGFPGTTNRYYTSWEVKQRRNIINDRMIKIRDVRQKEMLDEMLADPQVRIQYSAKYAASSNYWKNSIGMNRGIDKLDVIGQKEKEEAAFRKWALDNNKPEYLRALDSLKVAIENTDSIKYQLRTLTEALYQGIEFRKVPYISPKLVKAIKSKNKDIIAKELDNLKESYQIFANKDYNRKVDNRVAKAMLKAYMKDIPPADRPDIFAYIDKKYKGNTDKFIDDCFKKSIFGSDENFEKFLKKPTVKAIENDPMIMFSRSVSKKGYELTQELIPYNNDFALANKEYIKGLLEMNADKPAYPDANFSIRLTYGQVLPYSPADGIIDNYYTTLKGVMEKEDPNNWEFVVPEKLKKLYETKDFGPYAMKNGEMPCCFISNNDITGGNSGSPVINANGELIGAAFDGNWEAMSGDIVFEPDLQRTISVDIRYILFIIDKYANAGHLLKEMNLVK